MRKGMSNFKKLLKKTYYFKITAKFKMKKNNTKSVLARIDK